MNQYQEEVFDQAVEMLRLIVSLRFWLYFLMTVIPTALVFKISSGVLFILYFSAVCFSFRSAKLGCLIGWLIAAQTIFLFFSFPEAGHFIEIFLRAPARSSSNVPSSEQVLRGIPITFSSKLFLCLVMGARLGIVGLGLGLLGRKIFGYRSNA
ncbi:hypothetical protein [Undibacterium curvum]|jgi:hypothetical protein|uniref:hypothetical protein n=1 Tax=Undibacterium curvum TaxID=2762294 RepID=UPI003D0BD422